MENAAAEIQRRKAIVQNATTQPVFTEKRNMQINPSRVKLAHYDRQEWVVNAEITHNREDLLKPEYKNAVVYLDPRSTGVGQVMSFAMNFGSGGDMANLQPGFDYLAKLHKSGNVLRVLGTTPYAQFVKGEIPI